MSARYCSHCGATVIQRGTAATACPRCQTVVSPGEADVTAAVGTRTTGETGLAGGRIPPAVPLALIEPPAVKGGGRKKGGSVLADRWLWMTGLVGGLAHAVLSWPETAPRWDLAPSFFLGAFFGSALVICLVGYGVAAVVSLFDPTSRRNVRVAFAIAACGIVLLGVAFRRSEREQKIADARAAQELLDTAKAMLEEGAVPATETAAPPDDAAAQGELQLVTTHVKTWLAGIQQETLEYQRQVQAEGMDTVLAPANLATLPAIRKGRERVKKCAALLDGYEKRAVERMRSVTSKVEALPVSARTKREFIQGYERGADKGEADFRAMAESERAVFSHVLRMLDFMESRFGTFEVSGSQILFGTVEDVKAYDGLVKRLDEIAAEQARLVAERQKSSKEAISKFEQEVKRELEELGR